MPCVFNLDEGEMSYSEKLQRQHELEELSVGLGIQRYRAERPMPWQKDSPKTKDETELPPGRALMYKIIDPLAEAITETIERAVTGGSGRRITAVSYIANIDPDIVAYMTARHALNGAVRMRPLQAIAVEIGNALEDHVLFCEFEDNAPGLFRHFEERLKRSTSARHRRTVMKRATKLTDVQGLEWSQRDKVLVGQRLIELLIDVTGWFELTNQAMDAKLVSKGIPKKMLVLRPTEKCEQWLDQQHARCELLAPLYLPMIVKPEPWTNPVDGGYLDKKACRLSLVKTRNKEYKDELFNVYMPEVYNAVNAIQETPWRVNNRVLDVLRGAWDSGSCLGGLPPREDYPLPPKPADIETNEVALKKWKGEAARIHLENAQLKSKRLAMSQKLWIAEKFKDEEEIFFPHQLDFRGRIYPTVPFVNPQGDDTGKAVLEFAEGKPLTERGAWWLAVHIANLFGVDKVSFDERVAWTHEHEEEILDSANDPLNGGRFWTQADDPYCALAACFEWAGYREQGPDFISHLPIALDGSCSGLQHFSAMLRDEVGGAAVNLIPAEKPADIYSEVARVAQSKVDNSEDQELAAWKGNKVVRKIAKQPCMTLSYGATRYGMQEQIEKALKKLDADGEEYLPDVDNYDAAKAISYVINTSIGEVVIAAKNAMAWLQKTARLAASEGIPLHWTTPVGLPVLQEYRRTTGKRVAVFFGGRRYRVTLATQTPTLDKRRQANGISPNFVHSLDAAHLMKTANLCVKGGIQHFAFIHDSYATHACHTDELAEKLREAFVEQYTPDVLENFRKEIMRQLPPEVAEKIPAVPKKGNLELEEVKDSLYFFA